MRLIDADKFAEDVCNLPAIDEHSANAVIFLLHEQQTVDIKTEVAKEIFAEIKQGLDELSNTHRENSNYSGVVHTIQARGIVIDLENKYIGGVGK